MFKQRLEILHLNIWKEDKTKIKLVLSLVRVQYWVNVCLCPIRSRFQVLLWSSLSSFAVHSYNARAYSTYGRCVEGARVDMHAFTPGITAGVPALFLFVAAVQAGCPQRCFCPSIVTVECSGKNLTAIPENMDGKIKHL